MLRHCTKLRSLASSLPNRNLSPIVSSYRLLHFSPSPSGFHQTLNFPSSRYGYSSAATTGFSLTNGVSRLAVSSMGCTSLPHHFVQSRNITSKKDRMAKWKKKWRPRTPITSKVKKTKMKFYSSYKDRFKTLNDGTIRRWKEGKRHNAHLKSKKSKRRLRQPALVPLAYAKVMKKLNFCN